jgi:hypothetical protein
LFIIFSPSLTTFFNYHDLVHSPQQIRPFSQSPARINDAKCVDATTDWRS